MSNPDVDAVIDEVLGGDLDMQERDKAADEAAYQYFSQIRAQQGSQLDDDALRELNKLVLIPQEEKNAILQQTNRVARRVLRPLGYKVLQLQGLDPTTIDAATARAALETELTPQQQAEVDAEAERLFKQVYVPEMQAAMEDVGIDTRSPEAVWQQFGEQVMGRTEPAPTQQNQTGPMVVGAIIGAVVAFAVSSVVGWIKRRRQQQQVSEEEEYDSNVEEVSVYED